MTAVCPGAVKTEFFNRALTKKHLPAYKKLVMADPKKVLKKLGRIMSRIRRFLYMERQSNLRIL